MAGRPNGAPDAMSGISNVAWALHERAAMAQRVILVDDEEALVWSLASRLAKSRPHDRFETAYNGADALQLVQAGPVDLLVADVRMPGMNGIDLVLAARDIHPGLPAILMTAFKSIDIKRAFTGPFTRFLEKPFRYEELIDLFEQALDPQPTGFSGAINVQTMPDIVQLYALSSATGVLTIRHAADVGEIWFEQGSIRHAVTSTKVGDDAVYETMMWSGGQFWMRPGERTTERSVRSNWQELLMESCRRIDERRREGGGRPSKAGWTQAPPPPTDDDDGLDFAFSDSPTTISTKTLEDTMNVKDALVKLNSIDGFVGAALVDSESGMLLGQEGGGPLNLEIAAAGNTEVVRAKRKTMTNLSLKDGIEDILITLGKQYHLIRPLRSRATLFFYVALDRSRANLAMARIAVADVEKELQV